MILTYGAEYESESEDVFPIRRAARIRMAELDNIENDGEYEEIDEAKLKECEEEYKQYKDDYGLKKKKSTNNPMSPKKTEAVNEDNHENDSEVDDEAYSNLMFIINNTDDENLISEAIEQLDEETIIDIVSNDFDSKIRNIAIEHIYDKEVLLNIRSSAADSSIERVVEYRLKELGYE